MPEPMEHGECLESPAPRVTVALMVCLVCPATKDIGVTWDPWALWGPPGRTERGETTETSDPGVFRVNRGPAVCWDPKARRESLALQVCVETMAPTVPRATWVHKGSLVLQGSREPQELRECQDLKEPSDRQERRVPQENQVCQECLELMALLVTQGRRGLPAQRETRVLAVLREPSATLVLVASREPKESAA